MANASVETTASPGTLVRSPSERYQIHIGLRTHNDLAQVGQGSALAGWDLLVVATALFAIGDQNAELVNPADSARSTDLPPVMRRVIDLDAEVAHAERVWRPKGPKPPGWRNPESVRNRVKARAQWHDARKHLADARREVAQVRARLRALEAGIDSGAGHRNFHWYPSPELRELGLWVQQRYALTLRQIVFRGLATPLVIEFIGHIEAMGLDVVVSMVLEIIRSDSNFTSGSNLSSRASSTPVLSA